MLLTIDSGNTNVVFGIFDDELLVANWRSSNDAKRTADEFAVWLTQLMTLRGLATSDVTDVIIASVVPAVLYNLEVLSRSYFNVDAKVVGRPDIDLGLDVLIDRPEQVGADRLVNGVAAVDRHGGPLIVVDFGTATTFDLIDAQGNYCGGVIAPGINLSIEALYMAAEKLPRISIEVPPSVIGKATVPAMQSGVYWGYVGLIEGIVARIKDEYGEPLNVVATGGLAPLFANATDVIRHVEPNMTLHGLRLIHRRNTRS